MCPGGKIPKCSVAVGGDRSFSASHPIYYFDFVLQGYSVITKSVHLTIILGSLSFLQACSSFPPCPIICFTLSILRADRSSTKSPLSTGHLIYEAFTPDKASSNDPGRKPLDTILHELTPLSRDLHLIAQMQAMSARCLKRDTLWLVSRIKLLCPKRFGQQQKRTLSFQMYCLPRLRPLESLSQRPRI